MKARALELATSAFCAAFLTAACAATPAPLTAKSFGSFRATDPTDVTAFWSDANVMDLDHDGATTREEILSQLPNEGGHVTRARVDRWGKLVALGVNESESGARYDLTFDYGRYRTDGYEPHGETQLIVHSGIGTRIHAHFTTSRSGIDLTSLDAIGAAADDGDVQGTLELQAIGMSSPKISQLIPLATEISSLAVSRALVAAARIKTQLYAPDDDVQLTVQVFGRRNPGPSLRIATSSIAQRGVPQGSPAAFRSREPEVSSAR
jgi:hypothetical protein